MARFVVVASMLAAVYSSTATIASASDDPETQAAIDAAAALVGVRPVDVEGAMNTLGESDPIATLRKTGDLPTPMPSPAVASAPAGSIWDRLADCESNGRWSINTGNRYYGGLQEDLTFWNTYGGQAYAPRPDLASRSAQIAVAQRGQAAQGWGAWPRCSRIVGLR